MTADYPAAPQPVLEGTPTEAPRLRLCPCPPEQPCTCPDLFDAPDPWAGALEVIRGAGIARSELEGQWLEDTPALEP